MGGVEGRIAVVNQAVTGIDIAVTIVDCKASYLACGTTTPLGVPVEPEVYIT